MDNYDKDEPLDLRILSKKMKTAQSERESALINTCTKPIITPNFNHFLNNRTSNTMCYDGQPKSEIVNNADLNQERAGLDLYLKLRQKIENFGPNAIDIRKRCINEDINKDLSEINKNSNPSDAYFASNRTPIYKRTGANISWQSKKKSLANAVQNILAKNGLAPDNHTSRSINGSSLLLSSLSSHNHIVYQPYGTPSPPPWLNDSSLTATGTTATSFIVTSSGSVLNDLLSRPIKNGDTSNGYDRKRCRKRKPSPKRYADPYPPPPTPLITHKQQQQQCTGILRSALKGGIASQTVSGKSCKYCGKFYASTSAHSMHVRTHEMRCICSVCGKRFSRTWLLQCHMRTHTGEKPFRCDRCDKAFTDKSNYRAHTQTHSDVKPFACRSCGKAFALRSYLYKHERSCSTDTTCSNLQ